MKQIHLNKVDRESQSIKFDFKVSTELERYFTEKEFVIEYPENLDAVPDAVLAIPFVCNILPIVWLEDAELIIPELDKDFYNSIPEFKKGYISMYPDAEFKGKITAGKVINCNHENLCGTATFFSGGLDATTTLLRHLDEKPDLISIWGSDISYDNAVGWGPIQKAIDEGAEEYGVKHINIHSSFRQFDKEVELEKAHREKLHDGWWHGVKHGIGLIGHAAPYVYLHNIRTVYIASTYSPRDGKITCASDPTIDNYIRLCGANIVHDGFELGRQGKIKYLVNYHKNNPEKNIQLHVCWESSDGNNCCHCEKCYRTMMGIWIEGDDPRKYGLNYPDNVYKELYKKMALQIFYLNHIKVEWKRIQEAAIENRSMLHSKPYYKDIKWIEKFDFNDIEGNWCRKWEHIKKAEGVRGKLSYFKFYQRLHDLKEKIK